MQSPSSLPPIQSSTIEFRNRYICVSIKIHSTNSIIYTLIAHKLQRWIIYFCIYIHSDCVVFSAYFNVLNEADYLVFGNILLTNLTYGMIEWNFKELHEIFIELIWNYTPIDENPLSNMQKKNMRKKTQSAYLQWTQKWAKSDIRKTKHTPNLKQYNIYS